MGSVRVPFLRIRLGISAAVCLALGLAAAAAAAPRIVAVGDVHGALPAFQGILEQAGVLDASGAWAGGETVLVQVGDLIDRGPSTRGTLDFVMELEQSAPKHGGRVVSLLGNHEVLNLTGDLRYVTPANFAEFADAESEKRREDAWRQVRDLRKRRARKLGQPEPPGGAEARKAWFEAHPPGYLEQREAFGPRGKYGRWLRSKSALFVSERTAFMHGGLSPTLAGISLEEIGRRVREDLARFDADWELFEAEGLILSFFDIQEAFRAIREELEAPAAASSLDADRRATYERFLDWGSWTMNSADGPLWFRGFARWSDAEGEAEMPALLSAAGVDRFVVGHSPQENGRIRVRFGGAVFLIDTGMLSSYVRGGQASALEIADGAVSAIDAGGQRQVIWQRPRAAARSIPSGGRRPVPAMEGGSR